MVDWVDIGEKAVKLAFGIAKLTIGSERIGAAEEIFALATDGRSLFDDLTAPEEVSMARAASDALSKTFAALSTSPDWPQPELALAKLHLEQALPHCRPDPARITGANLDIPRIIEALRQSVIAKGDELAIYYEASTPSRRLFEHVFSTALKAVLSDADFMGKIAPTLWSESLSRQEQILAAQERTNQVLGQIMADKAIAEAALRRIYEAFSQKKQSTVHAMRIEEVVDQITPMVEAYLAGQDKLRTRTGTAQTDELHQKAADLKDNGDFEAAQKLLVDHAHLLDGEASGLAGQLQAQHDKIADTYVAAAETMEQIGDYIAAFSSWEEAANYARHDPDRHFRYRVNAAKAIRQVGTFTGSTNALLKAVDMFIDIRDRITLKDKKSIQWAEIEHEIGISASAISTVSADRVWLEEAATALLNASEYWKQIGDEARFFETGLRVSATIGDLAMHAQDAGQIEAALRGVMSIEEMAYAHEAPERVAALYEVKGNLTYCAGSITKSADITELALAEYDKALAVKTAVNAPIEHAMLLKRKAITYAALNGAIGPAASERAIAALGEAEKLYDASCKILTAAATPLYHAELLMQKAGVHIALGQRLGDADEVAKAVMLCETALRHFRKINARRYIERAEERLGDAHRIREQVLAA